MSPFSAPNLVAGFVLEAIHAISRVPRRVAIAATRSRRSSFRAVISQTGFLGMFLIEHLVFFFFAFVTDKST